MVVAEPELATPSPVQPEKSYPVIGVATIVGVVPWLKEPAPEIEPPEPAAKERVYDLMEKLAVSDLA